MFKLSNDPKVHNWKSVISTSLFGFLSLYIRAIHAFRFHGYQHQYWKRLWTLENLTTVFWTELPPARLRSLNVMITWKRNQVCRIQIRFKRRIEYQVYGCMCSWDFRFLTVNTFIYFNIDGDHSTAVLLLLSLWAEFHQWLRVSYYVVFKY